MRGKQLMRIISMLVSLPMLWTMIVPQHALAAEFANTDETKTNFKIEENIIIVNGNIYNREDLQGQAPYNFPGYEPVKSETEQKREKVLAVWKAKQSAKWENLPQGEFTINASAYTAAADECGWNTGITASGLQVEENRTIACPPAYPFGVKVKIDGYGTFVCEDRGGAIKGNHFDIYMQTKTQAFAFGRKNLTAEIVIN
jgi:3D (Asp-Asp-Asp) domain-containing protein